ncbi:chaplin [Streptomyces cacaoi]|uniref:chaplin n=1 Tax=Streptomyces cacaoi TaxID=1898 RepID=UPI0007C489A9|nr:chaplin [Streptomyces cacaoi]NNG85183.1 chaplin [Streptomyces cacaoi]
MTCRGAEAAAVARRVTVNNLKKAVGLSAATVGVLAAGAGAACAQSGAQGLAANSPGVASGNTAQVPVHVPVNLTGNSVNVVGVLNPAFGNSSFNN